MRRHKQALPLEECEAIFSRLTSEQLSIFKVSFDIENSSIKAFEAEFKEYKQGEILVSDENLGLEKQRFSAKVDSSTTSSISTYKTYHISLTECSDRHLSGVMLGEMTFEVDNITQEISQKARNRCLHKTSIGLLSVCVRSLMCTRITATCVLDTCCNTCFCVRTYPRQLHA